MHNTPIAILVGPAGSGKDTVAGFMVKNHGAVAVAHADPMKRLAKLLFGFTDDQLWGPSESRNAVDPRFQDSLLWSIAENQINRIEVSHWIDDIFDRLPEADEAHVRLGLRRWLTSLQVMSAPMTPRLALQTLGTEWGRSQGRDIWTDYTIKVAIKLLGGGYRYDRATGLHADAQVTGPSLVVITDGRFRNEVLAVKSRGGMAVKVADASLKGLLEVGIPGHQSEAEQKTIPPDWFDFVIANNKANGLADLEGRVEALFAHLHFVLSPRMF